MTTTTGPTHQGLHVKPLLNREGHVALHPYLGVPQLDPESLRRPDGSDPILVLADGRTLRAVRADHAAELLLPETKHRPSQFRLATDQEVAAFEAAEKAKAEEYRAAEEARINREAEEARQEKLTRARLQAEVETAKQGARR